MRHWILIAACGVVGYVLTGCTASGLNGFRARQVESNPAIVSMESARRTIGWWDWFKAEPLPAAGAAVTDVAGAGAIGWGVYTVADELGGGGDGDTYNISGNQGPVAIGGGSASFSSSKKE